jgi:hypothetical protein
MGLGSSSDCLDGEGSVWGLWLCCAPDGEAMSILSRFWVIVCAALLLHGLVLWVAFGLLTVMIAAPGDFGRVLKGCLTGG